MVVFNVAGPPSLFINETRNANHRVLFRPVGTKSNRVGIGARVAVTTSVMTQIDEVRGGGSYNSSNDTRLHFGLGADAVMQKIEVRWPSGTKQDFENVHADAIYEINETSGIRKLMPLPILYGGVAHAAGAVRRQHGHALKNAGLGLRSIAAG